NGGDTKGVVTRLGVRVFQTLEREEGGKLQPYATLNWWHDQASTSVGFSDTVLGQLFPRDRYELKLGIGARLARGWSSWGNVGGQWGGQGYRQYALRLGARYAW
ncbi:MAG: autotransporter outer membrane beta-barrel domain-containing protein, partial [Cupriavidus sp.]|nr:autotransporter outer membrane beta-barrel domain-containing protein [Cupriavidus sp.]